MAERDAGQAPQSAGRAQFKLSDEQRLNWLRLSRSQNVGPIIFRDLISHYGTAAAALEALPELAARGGAASRIRVCSHEDALAEMERTLAFGGQFVGLGEPDYPATLRESEYSPPLICYRGRIEIAQRPCLAVVGSRNASITGMKLARRLAGQISAAGYTIVSGIARGIDASAHEASLAGGTVAVFAGGIDTVFPPENRELAAEILEHGGLHVTEMPFGWQPRAKDFPRRNRIVTGLSMAVLVVEAAQRSGSLITARLANEAGRLVLAVPGSPLDPRSTGTNGLIRQGATLVGTAEDILEALAPLNPADPEFLFDAKEDEDETADWEAASREPEQPSNTARQAILNALGPSPTEIDDIIRFTGIPAGEVQLVLLELALANRLERHGGQRVSLIADP